MTDTVQLLLLCCGSILVGGLFIYLLFLRRKPDTHVTEQEEKKQQHQQTDQREVNNATTTSASSKKQAKSKKRREAQQEFTHSWMVGALKGHTGPVLDMDFSANGKFLASCADEAAGKSSTTKAKKLQQQPQPPPSPSGSSKSSSSSTCSSSSSSSSEQEPQRAILSRRQRKNRTRAPRRDHDDDRPPPPSTIKQDKAHHHHHSKVQEKAKQPVKEPKSNNHGKAMMMLGNGKNDGKRDDGSSIGSNKKAKQHHHREHNGDSEGSSKPRSLAAFSDAGLSVLLRRHMLTSWQEMSLHGYPFEQWPGSVVIYHQYPHSTRLHHHHRLNNQHERKPGAYNLDANAREFVPAWWSSIAIGAGGGGGCSEVDSGRGSGASSSSSSPEGSDLEQESCSSDSDKSSGIGDSRVPDHAIERRCVRCSKAFFVHEDKCIYHWGRLRSGGWECCRARESARGCTAARNHVWTGIVAGLNGPFDDFAKTEPARPKPLDGNYGVYALDCEMCFTKRGLEVGRVTLVDLHGKVVYETMVRPDAPVIDYNTRFSGLRACDFVNAKSLREVQQELKTFVSADTILIGHGLENDLRALRLLHLTVIDTSVCYPHERGFPYRNSLKSLALTYLGKEIQQREHDSAEDARIALDLVYNKLDQHLGQHAARFSNYTLA